MEMFKNCHYHNKKIRPKKPSPEKIKEPEKQLTVVQETTYEDTVTTNKTNATVRSEGSQKRLKRVKRGTNNVPKIDIDEQITITNQNTATAKTINLLV